MSIWKDLFGKQEGGSIVGNALRDLTGTFKSGFEQSITTGIKGLFGGVSQGFQYGVNNHAANGTGSEVNPSIAQVSASNEATNFLTKHGAKIVAGIGVVVTFVLVFKNLFSGKRRGAFKSRF